MPRRVQLRQYGTQRTQNRSQRSSLPHRKRKRNQGQAKQEDLTLILLITWRQQGRKRSNGNTSLAEKTRAESKGTGLTQQDVHRIKLKLAEH